MSYRPSNESDDGKLDKDTDWGEKSRCSSDSEDEYENYSKHGRRKSCGESKESMEGLKLMKPEKDLFQEEVYYRTYRLSDTSQSYDLNKIYEFENRLQV